MSSNQPTNNPLAKRTTPQLALIHAAESVGVSAGLTVIAAIYQFWLTHGLNFVGLAQVAGFSFVGALGLIYKTIRSNPNLGPAVADTVGQFKTEIQLLLASHLQGVAQIIAQVTGNVPPVVSPPVQQSQPAPQQGASPWTNTADSQASPQVAQASFPVTRNWTNLSMPTPLQQPGQSQ